MQASCLLRQGPACENCLFSASVGGVNLLDSRLDPSLKLDTGFSYVQHTATFPYMEGDVLSITLRAPDQDQIRLDDVSVTCECLGCPANPAEPTPEVSLADCKSKMDHMQKQNHNAKCNIQNQKYQEKAQCTILDAQCAMHATKAQHTMHNQQW